VDPKLEDLIRKARRDLRRASGAALSEEEQAEDARNAQMEDLRKSLLLAMGVRVSVELYFTVTWIDGNAAADIKVDDRVFRIRKADDTFSVRLVEGSSERELVKIDSKDPQFAKLLLVAVGDACQASGRDSAEGNGTYD
jgi:hypothetical protein